MPRRRRAGCGAVVSYSSCCLSPSPGRASADAQHLEPSIVDALVAELRAGDVAGVGEVARARGPAVVDLLALAQQAQAVDRVVDGIAAALAHAAPRVADRLAVRIAARRLDRERDQVGMV